MGFDVEILQMDGWGDPDGGGDVDAGILDVAGVEPVCGLDGDAGFGLVHRCYVD